MKICIYGKYYLPYIIKNLVNDGHLVQLNYFSPDIDICIVESRFYMYELYRNIKIIKKKKIKLINSILDIPPWNLYYDTYYNKIKNYIRQTFYHNTNKKWWSYNFINQFKIDNKNSKLSNQINSTIKHYINTPIKNRIYFLKNYRNLLKFSDLNLSLSKFTQKLVKKYLKLDTEVCYPCVNSDYLLNLPKKKIKYDAINISRIVPYKNQRIFVEAAKKLNLKIIVLGRYSDIKIKLDCPHFYYIDHNKVMQILNQTRFYVAPSEFEGFGMTPVEALFLDLPVIASDIIVHREVLGKSAIYFKKNNVKDLVKKMQSVISTNYQPNNVKIKEKYSIEALKNRITNHIESLI